MNYVDELTKNATEKCELVVRRNIGDPAAAYWELARRHDELLKRKPKLQYEEIEANVIISFLEKLKDKVSIDSSGAEVVPIQEPDTFALSHMCRIKFECIVEMFDTVVRQDPLINLPSQWFRAEKRITLDAIKYLSDADLGRMLKNMYRDLEKEIDRYASAWTAQNS